MIMRFKLPLGGDVPPRVAARRLGLTLEAFKEFLAALICRGFPGADDVTGNFDLDAIDFWRRSRHPHLFQSAPPNTARNAKDVVLERLRKSHVKSGMSRPD